MPLRPRIGLAGPPCRVHLPGIGTNIAISHQRVRNHRGMTLQVGCQASANAWQRSRSRRHPRYRASDRRAATTNMSRLSSDELDRKPPRGILSRPRLHSCQLVIVAEIGSLALSEWLRLNISWGRSTAHPSLIDLSERPLPTVILSSMFLTTFSESFRNHT